jgi:hypothetical protein
MSADDMVDVRWTPESGLSSPRSAETQVTPLADTRYTITVTNKNGCIDSAFCNIRVKKRIPVHFSMNSLNAVSSGTDTVFIIYAYADVPITTSMHFDVVGDAEIYQPADSIASSVLNSKRYIPFNFDTIALGTTAIEIARIPGKVLQSTPPYSRFDIQNIVVDSILCPNYDPQPGFLSIASCFSEGRNVRLINPIAASIFPNPGADVVTLRLSGGESGLIDVHLVDAFGVEQRTWRIAHGATQSDYKLNLLGLVNGVYTAIVHDVFSSTSVGVAKVE